MLNARWHSDVSWLSRAGAHPGPKWLAREAGPENRRGCQKWTRLLSRVVKAKTKIFFVARAMTAADMRHIGNAEHNVHYCAACSVVSCAHALMPHAFVAAHGNRGGGRHSDTCAPCAGSGRGWAIPDQLWAC